MPGSLSGKEWEILIQRIKVQKCTPFLGAGAAYGLLPLGGDIARAWAEEYGYPLEDSANLTAVAQFVALMTDAMSPKEKITRMFQATNKSADCPDRSDPHSILASLPLPIYVTTNYDNLMTRTLIRENKDARQELCRWNKFIRDHPSSFDQGYIPTVANPVVFHLHGYIPVAESMVLTEDDYLNFLVTISREDTLLPQPIKKAFVGTSLLFVGYRMADWNFRLLLLSLAGFMENSLQRTHFAVMTPPAASEAMKQKAQDYLSEYYENIDVRVYWGTAKEFVRELAERYEKSIHEEFKS
jgi:hypothetical protein